MSKTPRSSGWPFSVFTVVVMLPVILCFLPRTWVRLERVNEIAELLKRLVVVCRENDCARNFGDKNCNLQWRLELGI